jgi:hypothetical protein
LRHCPREGGSPPHLLGAVEAAQRARGRELLALALREPARPRTSSPADRSIDRAEQQRAGIRPDLAAIERSHHREARIATAIPKSVR